MSSYKILAKYYDELIIDPEGVLQWADFTERFLNKEGSVLELASGSGAISEELLKRGYTLTLSDLSEEMLLRAKEKFGNSQKIVVADMRDFSVEEPYDGILCYNDSLNYLTEEDEVRSCFHSVNKALKDDGIFLFDVHTPERLTEFEEEYIEEGEVLDAEYQWSILAEEDYITHHLTFWVNGETFMEEHVQRVYPKELLKQWLKEAGFETEIFTDFTKNEWAKGEKYYFVCRKKAGI